MPRRSAALPKCNSSARTDMYLKRRNSIIASTAIPTTDTPSTRRAQPTNSIRQNIIYLFKRERTRTMQTKQGNWQSRRTLLQGLTAGGGAALLGPSMLANAWGQVAVDPRIAKIVEETISVDMHNHDGQPTFAKAPADRK